MVMPPAWQPRPLMGRLGVRLASLMAVTLLPLGIVAYLQNANLAREAKGRLEEALLGESLRAAAGEISVISLAQGLVTGLGQVVPGLIGNDAACAALLGKSVADLPQIRLLSFVPESGLMSCSSGGERYDYADHPLHATIKTYREPGFTIAHDGPLSGTAVIGVMQPVFDATGVYVGYLGAWLPHERLRVLNDQARAQDVADINFWTFNREGEVLTASMGFELLASRMPEDVPLRSFVGTKAQVFTAPSAEGQVTAYAVLPVVSDQLYLMSRWADGAATRAAPYQIGPAWLPALIWLAGLGMSIWAAELLVGRHVRTLNRAIAQFARGDRKRPDPSLPSAPLELREMAEAYSIMTDDIMRNEASLEDEVHQKEVLLREVHHRVKNNLQLIASIMNMQIRQAASPEAKGLLKGLQDRVMSLATIHRGLYQTNGLSEIHAQQLLSDITRQTVKLATGPGQKVDVTTDFADFRLTPDQAVPLSLLLTEALTNAIKYAGGIGEKPPVLSASLTQQEGGQAMLTVSNTVSNTPREAATAVLSTSTGLGAKLMVAFAQQIGGTLTQTQKAGSYSLQVAFMVLDARAGQAG